jgi:SAM-dependent methyltransferase
MSSIRRSKDDIETCLRGEKLYGDDFDLVEILNWFEEEKEGYASIYNDAAAHYEYFALNHRHGFRHIKGPFRDVLSIGGAYGKELLPVVSNARSIKILEPSQVLRGESIGGVPIQYVTPSPDGKMEFGDEAFDLITCFGALHHIPNVTTIVREMFRCLRPGGYTLIREPMTSMGDWRTTRRGVTKNERGIPAKLLRRIVTESGFEISNETKCVFSITPRLFGSLVRRKPIFNSPTIVALDSILASLFSWNEQYYRRNLIQKAGATCLFLVLKR